MVYLLAMMGLEEKDTIKELVVTMLASYLGIALGVTLLVELIKMLTKDWAKEKAPALTILLTFVLGVSAKVLVPDVYGPNTFKAWTLHGVILIFVAVIAAVFHDKFWNVVKGKLGGLIPGGVDTTDTKPPDPPGGAGGEAEKKP